MATKRAKVEVFQGADGDWYWHLVSRGRVVATGGEGYTKRSKATEMALSVSGGDYAGAAVSVVSLETATESAHQGTSTGVDGPQPGPQAVDEPAFDPGSGPGNTGPGPSFENGV